MRGWNGAGRWVLALAVLGTAPLAMLGGGCSSNLQSVQPDAGGGNGGGGGIAGTSGEAGTTGEAGTSGAAGATGGFREGAGAGGHSGAGGVGGGACPGCCDGNPYCSADGREYRSCAQVLKATLPSECPMCPGDGIYTIVWTAQTCGALGCVNPGAGGAMGCVGGANGTGGVSGASGAGGLSGAGAFAGGDAGGGQGGGGGCRTSSGGVSCPQLCSPLEAAPYCAADGTYVTCFLSSSSDIPSGCCIGGTPYSYVWKVWDCQNGCSDGTGGTGDVAGCR
jgi:hypothetical protein